MIVAKYKFNPSTYSDYLPIFNTDFTSYTKSDVNNSDGTITRTIESSSLPTLMRFGTTDETYTRSGSLLEILDMNTSNLTSMQQMFRYCINLTNITCNWNTSKVTTMRDAFQKCTSLTSLNLSSFDTSKVTNMTSMFNGSSNLTSLDLNNWDTSQVTTMTAMFLDCSSLTSLGIGDWSISKVTNLNSTFKNCSSLVSLDLNNWDTSRVTNMGAMFQNCSSLTTLDLNNWNTSKVTDLTNTFKECKALTQLDINNWDTSKVTNMTETFKTCSSLTSLDLGNWNTSNVTQMSTTFRECKVLTQLNISNWDVSKLNSTYAMFHSCSSLTSLDLSNWNTVKLDNSQYMFGGCSSLKTLDISNWNTDKISNMTYMFQDARSLYKVNLKYANNSTVSKIHEVLFDRSSTTKGYILSSVDFTSNKNWQRIKSSHNNFYLPQPLNKIGDKKDRLYWDEDKGHYCIEQNSSFKVFDNITFTGGTSNDDGTFVGWGDFNIDGGCDWKIKPIISYNNKHIKEIFLYNRGSYTEINISIKDCTSIDDANIKLNEDLPLTVLFARATPNIIDLPHLNKKYSLDTYMPTTYVECTNNPMQPSRLLLESDTVRYKPSVLETDTDYTIQFECKEKSDKKVKLNLGGTEKEVDVEVGLNHVSITTPSELSQDRLFLSGAGNKVSDIIVNKGEMNQYPEYFNGVQSTGELQDDGTYKIDIETSSEYKEVNIFNSDIYSMEDGSIDISSGINQNYANESRVAQFIPCVANTEYRVEIETSGGYGYICYYYDANKKYLGCNKEANSFYAITEDKFEQVAYVRFRVNKPVGSYNNVKLLGQENTTHKISIISNSPLAKGDKLYWNKSNKRYEIDRGGDIEVPTVTGDVIDLPRLYQRENTHFSTSTGNIKPSKIKLDYNDLD